MTNPSSQKRNPLQQDPKKPEKPAPNRARIKIFHSSPLVSLKCPYPRRKLENALSRMLLAAKNLGFDLKPLHLHLVSDGVMASLNKREMGLFGPTNILSFPGGPGQLNELVLSLDTWERESVLFGQNPEEYFILLLGHGMAHLAMLDHGPIHASLAEACARSAFAGRLESMRE